MKKLAEAKALHADDFVTYLSGSFTDGKGGTSFLEIEKVGSVLEAGDKYFVPVE